jgi:hypothetical protein
MTFVDADDLSTEEKERRARVTVGRALAIPPAEMFELTDQPDFEAMPWRVSNLLTELTGDDLHQDTLRLGIRDAAHLVARSFKRHGFPATFEEALPYTAHVNTTSTLATFARGENAFGHLYMSNNSFRISPDATNPHIEALVKPLRSDRGCPVASSEDDPYKAQPIFHRLGAWAGELTLHTIYREDGIEYPNVEP